MAPKRTARIEIRETHEAWEATAPAKDPKQRAHHLVLIASNGEPLAHSENFPTLAYALEGREAWVRGFAQVLAALALAEVTR